MHGTMEGQTVPVEVIEELTSALQHLLDVQVLLPALQPRPIMGPVIADLVHGGPSLLLEYVTKQGQQAVVALIAALNETKDESLDHLEAIKLINDAVTNRSSTNDEHVVMKVLHDMASDLAEVMDVLSLLPRLMQQKIIASDTFRQLKGPYIDPKSRIDQLIDALQCNGIDGLIELVILLRNDKQQEYIAAQISSRVQNIIGSTPNISNAVLLKLQRANIINSMDYVPKPTIEDKIAVLLCMSEYETLSPATLSLEKLSLNSDRQTFTNLFENMGFAVIDFSSCLMKADISLLKSPQERLTYISQRFEEKIGSRCDGNSVVVIYLTGLAYHSMDYTTTHLLLEGALDISTNENDSVTDEELRYCIDSLPTNLISVISDCQWRLPVKRQEPWSHLCSMESRTVVMTNLETHQSISVTSIFNECIRSFIERGSPEMSHYQFYQWMVHLYKEKTTDEVSFGLLGDIDRVLFRTNNLPIPAIYLCGLYISNDCIELNCGSLLGSIDKDRPIMISYPLEPEKRHKAIIGSITDTTAVLRLLDTVNIKNGECVHVFPTFVEADQIRVDLTDVNNDTLENYVSQSTCLTISEHSWAIKVREINKKFQITDGKAINLYVSNIEHVKSLLEKYARYIFMLRLKDADKAAFCSSQYKCFLSLQDKPLLTTDKVFKENPEIYEIDCSPFDDRHQAIFAFFNYKDSERFWQPLTRQPFLRIAFRENQLINSAEIRIPPDIFPSGPIKLLTRLWYRPKVNLRKSRYEGPTAHSSPLVVPLHSINDNKQGQLLYSIASQVKITALSVDPEHGGSFSFRLLEYTPNNEEDKYINHFKFDYSPSSKIQFVPPLSEDYTITIPDGELLTIHFNSPSDTVIMILDATHNIIPLGKLEVHSPPNIGNPVKMFEIELWSHWNAVEIPQNAHSVVSSLPSIVACEFLFEMSCNYYPLQLQIYGTPLDSKIVAVVGQELKLTVFNSSDRPCYLTVMCLEETGCIQILIEQVKIPPPRKKEETELKPFEKYIKTTLPKGHDSTTDVYKVIISYSPLRLKHLEQPMLTDYASLYCYNIPPFNNQVELPNNHQNYFCYQFTVQVNKRQAR